MSTDHEIAEKLYPEDAAMRMALEGALPGNLEKLRDHQGLTEAQIVELGKTHTELLTHLVPTCDAVNVHSALISGLTNPPLTQAEVDQRNKEAAAHYAEVCRKGREEFGFLWDKVLSRAKVNVAAKPELVKLLKESGLDNDYRFWGPVFRKARIQLRNELGV